VPDLTPDERRAYAERVEQEAERLYNAMIKTVRFVGTLPLMSVVADVRNGASFEKAASRTREVFYQLAANLTAEAPKA